MEGVEEGKGEERGKGGPKVTADQKVRYNKERYG
jgi:hypothetical protein